MRVYVDSSALVKRTISEEESRALRLAIAAHVRANDVLVSSALSWIEVSRTLRSRLDADSPDEVVDLIDEALSGILDIPVGDQVISLARRLGPSTLRSLDAIHLASATLIGADLVCAYDRRLLIAASELGFKTLSPA